MAAAGGKAECVRLLVRNGAEVDSIDREGRTALCSAAARGSASRAWRRTAASIAPVALGTFRRESTPRIDCDSD